MRISFILLVLPLLLLGCPKQQQPQVVGSTSASITQEQAIAIVWDLPEIKAWTHYVEKKSEGKARPVLIAERQTPETMAGNKYWAIGFYEDQTTYTHRWQSFLVRLDGKEILVDDVATGNYLGLLKWREKEKPMERVRETKEP